MSATQRITPASTANLAQQALTGLDEGTPESPAATDLIGQAVQALAKLAQIDPAQKALADQSATLEDSLADLSRSLRNYLENIEFNPKRLNAVEERLDLIKNLQRKYGATIEDVLAFAAKAQPLSGKLDQPVGRGDQVGHTDAGALCRR